MSAQFFSLFSSFTMVLIKSV
jgi:hypothetical protein